MNWVPENFIHALNLISMSIGNLLSFLKLFNNIEDEDTKFFYPSDETYFEEPWKRNVRVHHFSFASVINIDDIASLTKEQIIDRYKPLITSH